MRAWTTVLTVMCVFLLFWLWLGIRGGSKSQQSAAEHVVGGHTLGLFAVFFIAVSEFYSANTFLGAPGWAYEHGVPILNSTLTGLFALMVVYWIGPRIQRVGKEMNLLTQAHFLRVRFDSTLLGRIASLVALCALIPYISVQIMGAGYIFNIATEGHVPFWLGGLAAYFVVAICVFKGGLRGIGYIAVFKGIFMLVMVTVLAVLVIHLHYGTLGEMFRQIETSSPGHLTLPGAEKFFGYTWWTTSVLNGMLGYFMWPHLFSNVYAAESGDTIKRMAIIAPLYNLLSIVIIIIGFAGIMLVKGLQQPDQIMMRIAMQSGLPIVLVALIAAAALSATMVAGAALTLAATATLSKDLIPREVDYSDEKLKRQIQYLSVVIIGVSYLFSIEVVSTLQYIMLMTYGIVSQFFPLVLASLYWKRCSAAGAISGLISGSVVASVFTVGPYPHPLEVHPGIIGMAVNTLVLVVVSLRTSPPKVATIQQFVADSVS